MKIVHILTVIHDNSVTRLGIADLKTACATLEILEDVLGHEVEFGQGDMPERDRYELDRLNALLDDVYNYFLSTKLGINIPKPPKL
jgi:hypothetical protein